MPLRYLGWIQGCEVQEALKFQWGLAPFGQQRFDPAVPVSMESNLPGVLRAIRSRYPGVIRSRRV